MKVVVKFYGMMGHYLGENKAELELKEPTVKELVEALSQKYGNKVKEELLDDSGGLDYSYQIFVKGVRLTSLKDPFEADGEIIITNTAAGGNFFRMSRYSS